MAKAEPFDAVIVGSGQGGTPLAVAFAKAGQRTALVERGDLGGTCVNVGCTPTKTMVASGRVAYLARRSAAYGVMTGPVQVDLARVRQRKREIVERFRAGSEHRVTSTPGLELIRGEASFSGPRTLRVRGAEGQERVVTAPRILLNSGCRPAAAPVPGLSDVPTLDSTSIQELDVVPAHLLVLGGGYIALEFGQMFRRFGARVTIVERGPRLLPREDDDIAAAVADVLREDGIDVLLGAEAQQVARQGSAIALTIKHDGAARTLEGSHLLVATGRTPNTDALQLATAGVNVDAHGYIAVNGRLETSAEGVYAFGDVKGGPAFTHVAYDDFRILQRNLLENGRASIDGRMACYTMFLDPQLGRVGLTETEARQAGRSLRVAKLPMSSVARALEMDETRGLMKAVVDAETDQILGAAVLGIEGGEIMSVLQTAMLGRLPYTALRDGMFAHPTLAESLNNLFGSFVS